MMRFSFLFRRVGGRHVSIPELSELKRVLTLNRGFPSDALRARAKELVSFATVPDDSLSIRPAEVLAVLSGALALGIDNRTKIVQRALKETDECLSSDGNFAGYFTGNLAKYLQMSRGESELKSTLTKKLIRGIQAFNSSTLLRVAVNFRKYGVTDKSAWDVTAEQILHVVNELHPRSLTYLLKIMSECRYYNKDLVDEIERIVLSSQFSFAPAELRKILDYYKILGRHTGNLHAFATRVDEKSHKPAVVQPLFREMRTNVSSGGANIPVRKTFSEQQACEESQAGLSLAEKEELERRILLALPRISLDDSVTVLVSSRQKDAETPAIVRGVCEEIIRRHSKDESLSSSTIIDVSLALIRSSWLANLDVSSKVEDALAELYDARTLEWIDPSEDPKLALRQVSIFTDVVCGLPRLAGTALLQSFISRVSSLGNQYEDFLNSTSNPLRQSLPSYAFQTVRLLSAANSFAALDNHRVGIALGLHGLPPAKAAELLMPVATLKSPPRPSDVDQTPLNAYLFEALLQVFAQRGVGSLNPLLAGVVLEALLLMRRSSVDLTLQCMGIIASDARSIVSDLTGTLSFDAKRHVIAVRRGIMMISSEAHAPFIQEARTATLDTVGMALRQPTVSPCVLVEALHAVCILITCEAATAARSRANEKRWNVLATQLTKNSFSGGFLEEKKAQFATNLTVRTHEISLIESIATRLRAALVGTSASETVTVLKCLGMIRDVPHLQTPLVLNELPLMAVKRATVVLGSGSPAIISGLITAAGVMSLPENVYGPFSRVCSRALLEAFVRECNSSPIDVKRACAYARAAHALETYGSELEMPGRFGALLWKQVHEIFEDTKAEVRRDLPSADMAAVLFSVSAAIKSKTLVLGDAQLKKLQEVAVAAATSPEAPCSLISFASFVVSLSNLGCSRSEDHPLYRATCQKQRLLASTLESLSILSKAGLKHWVQPDMVELSANELNALANAVADSKSTGEDLKAELTFHHSPVKAAKACSNFSGSQQPHDDADDVSIREELNYDESVDYVDDEEEAELCQKGLKTKTKHPSAKKNKQRPSIKKEKNNKSNKACSTTAHKAKSAKGQLKR